MGIEFNSVHHEADEVAERDELKNLLFKLAGIPLMHQSNGYTSGTGGGIFKAC
jgi:hypothetical protein